MLPILARRALLALTLAALAGPGPARAAPAAERAGLQAELDGVAARIEQLKREASASRAGGAELEGLLARAQELAALLERTEARPAAPTAPAGPDGQELRERADAFRDRADKAALALADLDRRLAEARRQAELAERLEALGAASDLFADGLSGRGATRPGTPGDGTQVTPGTPGTGAAGGAAAPALRSAAEPGGAGPAAGPVELRALARRRAELLREVAASRARAEALDAEAKAAEPR